MKSTLLLTFWLFLTVFTVFSQNTNFETQFIIPEKEKKFKDKPGNFEKIGADQQAIYFLNHPPYNLYQGKGTRISKYDHQMGLIMRKALDLKEGEKEKSFVGCVYLKEKIFVFSSFQNKDHNKYYLFVQSVNKETLEVENDIKMINEIDYSDINGFHTISFDITLSADKTKLLMMGHIKNRSYDNLQVGIFVFDDSFGLKWYDENIINNVPEGSFSMQQTIIDNTGDVFINGIHRAPDSKKTVVFKKDKKKGPLADRLFYYALHPDYTNQLLCFRDRGKDVKAIVFSLPDKFVKNIAMHPSKSNSLFCTGVYSNPGLSSASGFFNFNIDVATGKTSNINFKEFDGVLKYDRFEEDDIDKFRKEIKNEEEWDPYQYKLSPLIKKKNGQVVVVLEQYQRGHVYSVDGKYTTTEPFYATDNLLIVTMSAKGQIANMTSVDKKQFIYNNNEFLDSYYSTLVNDKLYFVFADILHVKATVRISKPSTTYIIEVDHEGNITRSELFGEDGVNGSFIFTNEVTKTSQNTWVFPMMSHNFLKHSFLKITINQ